MLFILTGDTQIGKTRWLSRVIDQLEQRGVVCYGVLSPGVWIDHELEGQIHHEKTGIESILLPQHDTIPFAQRSDLVQEEDGYQATQSASAKLAWSIDDASIDRVNQHFTEIRRGMGEASREATKGLLVVDEFGRLELMHDKGFTVAMSLVEAGATGGYQHALIVVREWLFDLASERFAHSWSGVCKISPDEEAASLLLQVCNGDSPQCTKIHN